MNLLSLSRQLRLKLLCLLCMTVTAAVQAVEAQVIAIAGSQSSGPYQQTLDSFKSSITQARPEIKFTQRGADEKKNELHNPDIVFSLGSTATSESLTELGNAALVATMILSDKVLQNNAQATAVLLKNSARTQLEWHRRLLPNARRIGVLYDPQNNQAWVDAAKHAASKLDLEIIAVPVESAKELPAALKVLGRQAESILGIADKTVYSSKTAKAVLLSSFRNRIPFVGLSSVWVKSGAIYALDWDYSELGQQCASIALQILDGKKARTIEPQLPDKQLYSINVKTAKHMKLSMSQELIDGAARVFK